MSKSATQTMDRKRAIMRQELRRSNAAVPHRNGRAKQDAKERKHRKQKWTNE